MNNFTTQPQVTFWDRNVPSQAPSIEARRAFCDWKNCEHNPFYNYIGNDNAVKQLNRAAFVALGRYNHLCNDQSFALIGPASTGKTTLARMFANTLELPFAEINGTSCSSVKEAFLQIAQACEDYVCDDGGTLELLEHEALDGSRGPIQFIVPPCVVFIDEVHALPKKVEQGLLKATEKNDGMMAVEIQGRVEIVDCRLVCWIIATTDRGLLFDAFDTRFEKISLNLYTLDEMAQIVQVHNPDWDFEVCELVARFAGRVPREALAFAKAMRSEMEMQGGDDWEEVAETVAEEKGIDSYGMTLQQIAIITALGQGPISKSRLCSVANCKEEELLKYVLPPMLAATADQDALIRVSTKGFALTEAGAAELKKRNILYSPYLFEGKPTLSKRLDRNNLN